ncbi:MAG: hypothetical protein NDJ90_06380 [Oligoflexia bacterium]|nr:hypothetical protein [Oligoflexia bacterium]
MIAAISGGGSCSKDSTVEVQESQLVQDLVALLKRIRYRKHQNPKKPLELTEEEREGLARYIGNPNCLGALGLVPEFDVLEDILRAAHPKKMLAEVLAHRCKNGNLLKVSVPPLAQTLYAPAKSPTEIANFFADRIKARTDLPTQVTICEKVFNRPNYRLIAEPVEAWNRHSCKDSLHSMLVIGKRRNPESGRCEFLLRNSWGTDCGPSGVNFKCENGSIWVDADTLARVTLRAFELQRGKR